METYYQVFYSFLTSFLLSLLFFLFFPIYVCFYDWILVQESGRAGRDGLPSECLLFFRPADVPRQVRLSLTPQNFIIHVQVFWYLLVVTLVSEQSSMVFYENSGLQNLYDIVRYSQVLLLLFIYFGNPMCYCPSHNSTYH